MQLFHTSPTLIENVTKSGRFGEFLFFSNSVYAMTAGDYVTYSIEIDNSAIIEAGQLFYHEDAAKLNELVSRFSRQLGVSSDVAESLIDGSVDAHELSEIEEPGEASWDAQLMAAKAAKILGYRGVQVADEQGSAYMIDMHDHESELIIF